MYDFPEKEPDQERAEDDEESVLGLVEILREIVENEEPEELEGLTDSDVELYLETEPVTRNCTTENSARNAKDTKETLKKIAVVVSRIYRCRL